MKKILICLLISMCCFTPFSIYAEEESFGSYIISDDFSSLSEIQYSFFLDWLENPWGSVDLCIYKYVNYPYTLWVNTDISFTEFDFYNFNTVSSGVNPDGTIVTGTYVGGFEPVSSSNSAYYYLMVDGEVIISNIPTVNIFTSVYSGEGTVTGSGKYPVTDYFTVTAIPAVGYEFDYFEVLSKGDPGYYVTDINPLVEKSRIDLQILAHFKYTGLTPPDPTPSPTPTPEPDDPLYQISTDFNYLLSNPAIASLVQYAINDLGSNTWWIERELYYYESASCPSGSTPLYSNFGYVERFVLYNYTSSGGLEQISDSLVHQGQSSLGCLISSGSSSVVIPDLESSPRVTETLFYGFDLFEIPDDNFYQLLVEIKNTLNDSSVSNSINNVNNSIVSGNGISQNVTSSLVDSNSSLYDAVSQYDQAEKAFTDDFKVNVDAIDTDFSWGSQFLNSANFVRASFNELVEPAPIYNMILFSLILGFALFIIGRLR